MKFARGLYSIKINGVENESFQYFSEDQNKIVFRCAEDVPHFVRGYVADFEWNYLLESSDHKKENGRTFYDKNTVLVYINQKHEYNEIPTMEYVFYK